MPSDADLQAMSQIVNKAMADSTAALLKFANTAKEASTSGGFKQTNEALASMAKLISNPVTGLTALLYGAGKAVSDFADQRLKLSLFAKDVGLSASSIYGLREAMFNAGKETEEANRAIGAFGASMKDLQANRYGSAIYKDLVQLGPGMQEVANELLRIADSGDFDKALKLLESKWKDWGPRTRHFVAQELHMMESDIEATFGRINETLDAATQAAAERHAKQIRSYRTMFGKAWEHAMGGALDAIDAAGKRLNEPYKESEGKVPQYGIPKRPGAPADPDSVLWPWLRDKAAPWMKEQFFNKGEPYVPLPLPGKQSLLQGEHPMTGNVSARADDLIQVETDSSKTLRDIRDTLQRMEAGGTGGGGGGGSGGGGGDVAGGGRRSLATRLGMDRGGGDGGGPGAQVGANNFMTGMMKRGWSKEAAAMMAGNVAEESGFSTSATGDHRTAHGLAQWRLDRFTALKEHAAKAGKPWTDPEVQMDFLDKEFRARHGDEAVKSTDMDKLGPMGKAYEGYSTNTYGKRMGAARSFLQNYKEGGAVSGQGGEGVHWTSGYGWRKSTGSWHAGVDYGAPTGTEVHSAGGKVIRAQVQHGYGNTVDVLGEDGVVRRYAHLSRMGVKEGDVLKPGDVLGNVGSTGTHSTGPHLHYEERPYADYQRNPFGFQGTRDPSKTDIPGILGLKRRIGMSDAEWAQRKSKALSLAAGEGALPEGSTLRDFTGYGSGIARGGQHQPEEEEWADRHARRQLDIPISASRSMLDGARSGGGGDASMSATVDFKNMPAWVRTAVDDNGRFKNLKVTRSTPQNGRAGSGQGDYNPWAYE